MKDNSIMALNYPMYESSQFSAVLVDAIKYLLIGLQCCGCFPVPFAVKKHD